MKKTVLILLIGLIYTLSGCSSESNKICEKTQELNTWNRCVEVEFNFEYSHTLSLVDETEHFTLDESEIDIYTNSHDKGISYVSASGLVRKLGTVLRDFEVEEVTGNQFTIEIDINPERHAVVDYEYTMIFDADDNTISINDFSIFSNMNGYFYTPDLSYAIYLMDYETTGSPSPVVIDLDEYDIDLVYYHNEVYLPIYLADLFLTGNNINLYEMKDVLVVYFDNISGHDLSAWDKKEQDDISNVARNTENFLILYMDYFYGLKEYFGLKEYDEIISFRSIIEGLDLEQSEDYDDYFNRINKFLLELDDIHTQFITAGYNHPDYKKISEFSEGSKMQLFTQAKIDNECDTRTVDHSLEIIDDTAYIEINKFYSNIDDLVRDFINIRFQVDLVEIDLTCNTGGNVKYMISALTLVTTKRIPITYYNPSTDVYTTLFYASPTTRSADAEYTVIVSNVTFSAGNLFASIVQDLEVATIVGNQTAGGAAAVAEIVLPDGSIISGSRNMIFLNQNLEIIEDGILPESEEN